MKSTLLKRTASGALFLCLMVGGLLLSEYAYLAIMLFVLCGATVEFYRMTSPGRFRKEKLCIYCAVSALYILAFCCRRFGIQAGWMALAFLPVLLSFILLIYDCKDDYEFNSALYMPLPYIMLPVVSTLLLVYPSEGVYTPWIILSVFFMVWMNDVGAYCLGMAFGQRSGSRKLFPEISPKKSWIGAAGGTVFTLATAVAVYFIYGRQYLPLWCWIAIAAAVATVGVYGDLFESLIKRHANVKDSGNVIPGHGGVMDRFDDVLFVMPVVAIILIIQSLI